MTTSYTAREIMTAINGLEAVENERGIKASTSLTLEKLHDMAAVLRGEWRQGMKAIKTGGNGRRVVVYG